MRKAINKIRMFGGFSGTIKYLLAPKEEKYAIMQKGYYNMVATHTDYESDTKEEDVVGSYEEHNNWKDYDDFLMKYVNEACKEKYALDFACGPGRNILKYGENFKRLDGADIAEKNLENARKNFKFHNYTKSCELFLTNGKNLGNAQSNFYDLIFSTIAMQHICVWETRYTIISNMFKSLKIGGRISIQMGYGINSPNTVDYYENNYLALETNRGCDTRIESPEQVEKDLEKIGFSNFEYWIRPVGPGDLHPNWIFFTATK